jgi:FkbM family methyltransferase
MNTNIAKCIDILASPNVWINILRWPVFSHASYNNCFSMRNQGHSFSTIIDIGANVGQFSIAAMNIFKPECIHAFEPVKKTFDVLKQNSRRYPEIKVNQIACGDEDRVDFINLNNNSQSASILPRSADHKQAFPGHEEIGKEEIRIKRLDTLFKDVSFGSSTLLKIDAQGFERNVIRGAEGIIDKIDAVFLETSFSQMYVGESTFTEISSLLDKFNFEFKRPINFLRDSKQAAIVQMDCLFLRRKT